MFQDHIHKEPAWISQLPYILRFLDCSEPTRDAQNLAARVFSKMLLLDTVASCTACRLLNFGEMAEKRTRKTTPTASQPCTTGDLSHWFVFS